MRRGVFPVTVPTLTAPVIQDVCTFKCRLHGWSLGDAGNLDTPSQGSASFAAAAAGTLTLANAISVSSFVIEPAAAWPAGVNQVNITNLAGGTQAFDIPGGTTNPVLVTYSPPIGVSGGNPVISVPAIVGGPAYTIDAEFTVAGAAPRSVNCAANLLDAAQVAAVIAVPAGLSDTRFMHSEGIWIGSKVRINVLAGTVSGVVYVSEDVSVEEGKYD